MVFRKSVWAYTLTCFLILALTPKGIKKCVEKYNNHELKQFKCDRAFLKIMDLADTDNSGQVSPKETGIVRILAGLNPSSKKDLRDFTLKESEIYLNSQGYYWGNGDYVEKEIITSLP